MDRTGEIYFNKTGDRAVIIKFISAMNCTIKFDDGTILTNRQVGCLIRGEFRHPNKVDNLGVGFIGQGEYKSGSNGVRIKSYTIWRSVKSRCYNEKEKKVLPTYDGVTMCEEWYNYQNFAKWYEEKYKSYMKEWDLDKDILSKGSKIYSPETCCLVPKEINMQFTFLRYKKSGLPPGVTKDKLKFKAAIKIGKVTTHLGLFATPEEAFQAYKTAKELRIKQVADKWQPFIEPRVYDAMYNYEIINQINYSKN